jgi:hypothetical protein
MTIKEMNMVTEFVFPSEESPSSGSLRANINGVAFVSDGLNFAYDYHVPMRRMYLTLAAAQETQDSQGKTVVNVIEVVFSAEIENGRSDIVNGHVAAAYSTMEKVGGTSSTRIFNADEGSFDITFDREKNIYKGKFHFQSKDAAHPGVLISDGEFDITGRDSFTI